MDEIDPIAELLSFLYVQNARMLDCLYVLIEEQVSPEYSERLMKLHAEGGLLGPEPYLKDDSGEG